MKKNELWTGRCENYTHDGMGVIKKDGFPYFVKGLLKGEKALIRTIKLKKTYGFGKVEELLDESPARAIPPCPLAGRCGGCQLQMMRYEEQLRWKEQKVKNDLQRLGGFAEIPMVLKLGWRHGLVSPRPANYVVLGYKPHRENSTGVTRTMFGLTFFAPPLRRFYALRMEKGQYVPDLDGAARALARFARSPFPTRIVGFPSYLWFGLKRMEELGLSLRLRPGSQILLAGGWKQHAAQQVDKSVLYDLARKVLGVGEEHIHELFGAVEHPIFYNTCKHHHFHVPIYARVLIRDVRTLEPLPMGQAGLVNLITPLNRATPVTSVVTDDLGVLRPGEDCGCGIKSPYLTILGRVGMPEIQTCAAGAAELLGRGEGFS